MTRLTGELAFVSDPECKLRIIAMLDYTSQLFLKPIHTILLSCLRTIPMDRTFTQDPRHSWNENLERFHSLDLSAATDRFPVHLQRRLLENIFKDSVFADAWENLLINREFAKPGEPCMPTESVRYAVGQPMGAYSS